MATKTKTRPAVRKNSKNSKNSHVKTSNRSHLKAMPSSDLDSSNDLLRTIPQTTPDRLVHIQALGQRVGSYVKFMCSVGRMEGCSVESKDRAVAVFYDRLSMLEQELARIYDNLLLG
jgi:hypothetical protein